MNKELRKELAIDEYLELIKEDKNLSSGYTSLSQYIYLLEHQLEEKDKVIDEAIKQINRIIIKPTPFFKDLEGSILAPKGEAERLLEILERGKNVNSK